MWPNYFVCCTEAVRLALRCLRRNCSKYRRTFDVFLRGNKLNVHLSRTHLQLRHVVFPPAMYKGAPHPCQNLFSVLNAILVVVTWYVIVISICISPMTRDVEHLFMGLFWPFIHLLRRSVYSRLLPILKLGFCGHQVILLLSSKSSLCILKVTYFLKGHSALCAENAEYCWGTRVEAGLLGGFCSNLGNRCCWLSQGGRNGGGEKWLQIG